MADTNGVETELDERIIRQIEYYFGDYNLPRDKFLQEQIKLDEGWVTLSTLLSFKRLAALTKDEDRIIEALKKSSVKLVEIDEENKKIRRSLDKPVPTMNEERMKVLQSRTVYCKGFTKENSSLDKLLTYFGQYGKVENVQMRSYLDKATNEHIFKGSVFVLFATKELAEEFLKKETVEYEGSPLIVKSQEEYFMGKKREREEKKKAQKAKYQPNATKLSGSKNKDDDEEDKDSDNEEDEKEGGSGFPKGAIVHLKDVPNGATWEDIKSAVEDVWKAGAQDEDDDDVGVAYVEFQIGDSEGWVRLTEANTAKTFLERAKRVQLTKSKKKSKTVKKEVKEEEEESKKAGSKEEKEVEEKKKEDDDVPASGEEKVEEMKVKKEDEVKVKEEKDDEEKDVKKTGDDKKSKEDEDEPMNEDNGDNVNELAQIDVCGTMVEIRALEGSEEEAYLEKAQGAREKRFMASQRGRNRGGRRGGGRKGRGHRGGKRKGNWDGGPNHKRSR